MIKDIYWHEGNVTREHREKLLSQKGAVIWLYGLSASGKSTIAVEVEKKLMSLGKLCYRLDGDNIRHGLNSGLGFSPEDRIENIRRIAEVAKLFMDCGIITLVSFITPYNSMRELTREITGNGLIEVYVKAGINTCRERDPKGLYKKADNGEIEFFTGVTDPFEEPVNPHITIDTGSLSADEASAVILEYLSMEGIK